MTSARPYAPATSKNFKPDRFIGAKIFAVLVVVLFFVLDFASRGDWIPPLNRRQNFGLGVVSLLIILAFFWVVLSDDS
jgi:hypothetical protein